MSQQHTILLFTGDWLKKVYDMTTDHHLVCMVHTLLEDRRFYVECGGKGSRVRLKRNGLPQGSVLQPLPSNV